MVISCIESGSICLGVVRRPIYLSPWIDTWSVSMDLRQLRQFVAVAEELHFGRAARRLHMTQPPLTLAVRGLEAGLGGRRPGGSRRSAARRAGGDEWRARGRRRLRGADELPRAVKAAAEGWSGHLRLAFVSSIAYGPLPEWLRGFRE